jgi:hypothetical protein
LRRFAILAAAIVIFGVAAALLITLAPVGSFWPDAPGPGSPAANVPNLGPLPAGAPAVAPVPRMELPPVVYGPPPTQPPEGSWEAVKPVARFSALGPVGAAVGRELLDLQPELSACFSQVTQARHGQRAHTATQDESRLQDTGTTVLVLQLEMGDGEVQIVDAPVETWGGSSDGLVACAQGVLRGRVVKVPQARRGQRARVMFPLLQ